MKFSKTILLSLVFVLFQSNTFAQNYRIIFVYGPHAPRVSYDYYMQKSLYHLFSKLIEFSNGKIKDKIEISKFCSSKSGFDKYKIVSNANRIQEFVDKKFTEKTEKLFFVSLGKGQNVVDRALEDFSNNHDAQDLNNIVDSWQEVLTNKLFSALDIKDNDELSVIKNFLIAVSQDSYALNIDFNKLKKESRDFYKLLKKTGKILQDPFSIFKA
ncbi:MAG: hypothetical protein ABIF12_00430 [bacterium]